MITVERVKRFAPNARADLVKAIVDGWPTMEEDGINTPLRVAHFMAQIAHETQGFTTLEEGLSYTAQRLVQVWPKRFPNVAAAKPYARNPRALANKVYGSRLGNKGGDDGYNFRGSGFMQETGRANYRARGKELGIPLEQHPELLREPKTAFLAAVHSWVARGCNELADDDDVEGVTKAINGGFNGLDDRKQWLARARKVFKAAPATAAMPLGIASIPENDGAKPNSAADLPQIDDDEPDYPVAVIKNVQTQLSDMGYWTGIIDGNLGGATAGAITGFMMDRTKGAVRDGSLNEASLAEIDKAWRETPRFKRPISDERKNASADTVRAVAPEAKASFRSKMAAFASAIVAGFWSAIDWITDNFSDAAEKLSPLKGVLTSIPLWAYGLAVTGVAVFIGYQSRRSEAKTIQAYQERRLL